MMVNQSALTKARKQAKTMAKSIIKDGTKTCDTFILGWDDDRPIVIREKSADAPIDLVSESPDWYIIIHETTERAEKHPFRHQPIVMIASVKKGGPTVMEFAEIGGPFGKRNLGRFQTVQIWSGAFERGGYSRGKAGSRR